MDKTNNVLGASYTIFAVVLWSTIGIFVRWIPEVGAGLNVLYRFAFATIVLFAFAVMSRKKKTLKLEKKEVPFILIPTILISFTIYTYTIGLKTTTIANTVFLQQLAPIYVLITSYFLLKERVTKKTAAAVFMGISGGVAIIYWDYGSLSLGGTHFYGDMVSTLSGLGWAAYTISMRFLGRKHESLKSTFWIFFFGTIIMSPFFIKSNVITPFSLSVLFLLGAMCTALAFILYNVALRCMEATKVSVIVLLEGVLSGIWAYLILSENVTRGTLLGGGLIILATIIIILDKE
ncbi:MAG: DMT family transporter [Candidatus Methanofastidiosia archaeon]